MTEVQDNFFFLKMALPCLKLDMIVPDHALTRRGAMSFSSENCRNTGRPLAEVRNIHVFMKFYDIVIPVLLCSP
jgi:hypothetical protein